MTFRFFLGGHDLEMLEIAALARAECGPTAVIDKNLAWGARLSDYAKEIEHAAAGGMICVAVELSDDMADDWAPRRKGALLLIDHHGITRSRPCSLRQIFSLLGLPQSRWDRRFALVEANDVGHVDGMRRIGATALEMIAIRRADRAAQGVTPEEERSGLAALRASRVERGSDVLIVSLPHDRSATVADPLELEAEFENLPRNLLIDGATSVQVFGPRKWCDALQNRYPEGWSGGGDDRGFFGIKRLDVESSDIVRCILSVIESVGRFYQRRTGVILRLD